MIKFGIINKFEIWVDYFFIKFKDNQEFIKNYQEYKSCGDVYFWINGKNIFQFRDYGPEATYQFDLTVLISFLCNNLYYFITNDSFPVKTKANSSIEMIEEIKLIPGDDSDLSKWATLDWENIDMEVRDKIDSWIHRHSFLSNREGSFFPNAYIRKENQEVEISWNNTHPHRNTNGEFYFQHKQGVEFVKIKLFRDTIANFCLDFIEKFKNEYPNLVTEYKLNLQKAIGVDLE